MNQCDNCKMTQRCDELERMGKVPKIGKNCRCYTPVKPQTNADRIRAMTDEELADFLDKADPVFWTRDIWLDWLKQEAEK